MKKRPNILFFLPDQHRADWLGCASDLPLKTPNIDQLAADGTRFTETYCASPLCAPSRACLASGRSYDDCGVVDNGQNYPLDIPTYYQKLRNAGYRVAGVGKFDLHKPEHDWGLDGSRMLSEWGFTEGIDNEGKLDGSHHYLHNDCQPKGPYMKHLHDLGIAEEYAHEHDEPLRKQNHNSYITGAPESSYCDNWVAENGLHFLREFPSSQPWHLVVNFTGPHDPMDVTEAMHDKWKDVDFPLPYRNTETDEEGVLRARRYYAAMIENIDHQVGRFIEAVKARGELENTLIVYASDHGDMLGDFNKWGKIVWRELSMKIPLIMRGPEIAAGKVTETLVSLPDLAATFLDYAGVSAFSGKSEAQSLVPFLHGEKEEHRSQVKCGLCEWRSIRENNFKLIRDKEQFYLFDLEKDPREERDVSSDYPQVYADLKRKLME